MAKGRRRHEAVVEAVCAMREAERRQARLGAVLVQDIDTVTPAMSTGNRRRLSVKTHAQAAKVTELSHSSLGATKCTHAHAHGGPSAVHAAVDVTTGSEARRLEREYLV